MRINIWVGVRVEVETVRKSDVKVWVVKIDQCEIKHRFTVSKYRGV